MSEEKRPKVLLFSGGMDSFIAYHYLTKQIGVKPKDILLLYCNLHHRYAEKEIKAVTYLAKFLDSPLRITDIINLKNYEQEDAFIPLRNLFLIEVASLFLETKFTSLNDPIPTIYLITQEGELDLPDRSEEFFNQMQELLRKQYKVPLVVTSPFFRMTKQDMVKWYVDNKLSIPLLKQTIGCYSSSEKHCGECSCCLVDNERNKVWVLGKPKKPSEVKVNDWLLAYDLENKEFKPTQVKEVFTREVNRYYIITAAQSNSEEKRRIYITEEHPILVTDKGWVEAKDINVGDIVHGSERDYSSDYFGLHNLVKLKPQKNPFDNLEGQQRIVKKGNGYEVIDVKVVEDTVKVYNYHCEPFDNFLLNGIVVHNCFRKAVAYEYAGIFDPSEFEKDIRRWEGIETYIRKIKAGSYQERRASQTLEVLKRWGY